MQSLNAFIGNEIRVRRILRGISVEGLAQACGVDYVAVERWENGLLGVTAADLEHVAACLDVDPASFIPNPGLPPAA